MPKFRDIREESEMDTWLFGLAKANSKMESRQQILVEHPGPLHFSYVISPNLQNFQIRKVFIGIPIVKKRKELRELKFLV